MRSVVPQVISEKLNAKHPDIYSAFKISVYDYNVNSIIDSKVWPECTRISWFFHFIKQKNPE